MPQPSEEVDQPRGHVQVPPGGMPQPIEDVPQPLGHVQDHSRALPQPPDPLPQPPHALPQPHDALPQPHDALPQPPQALPQPLDGFLVEDKPNSQVPQPSEKLQACNEECKSDHSEPVPILPLAVPSHLPYYELPSPRVRRRRVIKPTYEVYVPYNLDGKIQKAVTHRRPPDHYYKSWGLCIQPEEVEDYPTPEDVTERDVSQISKDNPADYSDYVSTISNPHSGRSLLLVPHKSHKFQRGTFKAREEEPDH